MMLASQLKRWFAGPARREAPGKCPRGDVARTFPTRRPPHSPAARLTVQLAVSQPADGMVIRLKGEAGPDCGGVLLGGLLAPAARRPAVVTFDLSELRSISSLAMGILLVYRRGVVRQGGRLRLAEKLQPSVREALARAKMFDLFGITA